VEARFNKKHLKRPPYKVGDWVWLKQPKKVGGPKLEVWWEGPFPIQARVGDSSYTIRLPITGAYEVHADQLKPCVWQKLDSKGIPIVLEAPTSQEELQEEWPSSQDDPSEDATDL
jgi:hypothetical protein